MYKTITIGKQTWMAENLRVTRYRNGDPIKYFPLSIAKDSIFQPSKEGLYCAYNDTNDPDSIATYGLLYNGLAVTDLRGIAPKGWHVPTGQEWDTLITYLNYGIKDFDPYGSNGIVGGKLKEEGNIHWNIPNYANNSSGFTALPAGCRFKSYEDKGRMSLFWTSTSYGERALFARTISNSFISIINQAFVIDGGELSLRCIKDN